MRNISADAQNTGINPQLANRHGVSTRTGRNTYQYDPVVYDTERFGEISPFFDFETTGNDRIQLSYDGETRTYTFKSPLMNDIYKRRTFVHVPFAAILPRTWKHIIVDPKHGSDVPDELRAYTGLGALQCAVWYAGQNIFNTCYATETVQAPSGMTWRLLLMMYRVFSRGQLLDKLGLFLTNAVLDESCSIYNSNELGEFIYERMMQLLSLPPFAAAIYNLVAAASSNDFVPVDNTISDREECSLQMKRQLIEMSLQYPEQFTTNAIAADTDIYDDVADILSTLRNVLIIIPPETWLVHQTISESSPLIETNMLLHLAAYQMACAQMYTNENVDDIYNSSMWLENMNSILLRYNTSYTSTGSTPVVDYNGVSVQPDVFSRYWFPDFNPAANLGTGGIYELCTLADGRFGSISQNYIFPFWENLLTLQRPLKVGDYFLSGRLQPLAVGDTSIAVNGSKVDVIDVNRSLKIQRFLNAVNRAGSNLVDYCRDVLGYGPSIVEPQPSFLVTQQEAIQNNETTNTSNNQGAQTSLLHGSVSRYAFDVNISDMGIILGLQSYEYSPVHARTINPQIFHTDRYSFFNPWLQQIGDQSIPRIVVTGDAASAAGSYAYQDRYGEYKSMFNTARGGFATGDLSTWLYSEPFNSVSLSHERLTPGALRPWSVYLDRFYASLTGYGPAYFHFISKHQVHIRANRPIDHVQDLL